MISYMQSFTKFVNATLMMFIMFSVFATAYQTFVAEDFQIIFSEE